MAGITFRSQTPPPSPGERRDAIDKEAEKTPASASDQTPPDSPLDSLGQRPRTPSRSSDQEENYSDDEDASPSPKYYLRLNSGGIIEPQKERPSGESFTSRDIMKGEYPVFVPSKLPEPQAIEQLKNAEPLFKLRHDLSEDIQGARNAAEKLRDLANHKKASVIPLGQSPKLIKWALKHDYPDIPVTTVDVSGVKLSSTPSAEFSKYLERKLDKVDRESQRPNYILMDHIGTGDSVRAIARDILKLRPNAKITIVGLAGTLVGGFDDPRIIDYRPYGAAILGPSLSGSLLGQVNKNRLGRNNPKNNYEDWSLETNSTTNPAYQQTKNMVHAAMNLSYIDPDNLYRNETPPPPPVDE